jgi:hypothetical protein
MSAAAETYVKSLRHPKVKGGTRTVLDVIAQLIPEGETTTPLIGMQDLATPARLHRSTVWRKLDDLVDLGLIQILDRTPGRIARYHLVQVAGAQPITEVSLPLRADLRSVPRRSADSTPGLFDQDVTPSTSEDKAINLLQKITGSEFQPVAKDHRFGNLLQKITGWLLNLLQKITGSGSNLLQKITGRKKSEEPVAKDHRLPALPLDVDDARAGAIRKSPYVHTHVHTHTALRDEQPNAEEEPIRPPALMHPWHIWCDGLVHVPKLLHDEWLRKHSEAELFAFYARRAAVVVAGEDLTKNEIQIWRRRYGANEAFRAKSARGHPTHPQVSIPQDLYARGEEEQQRRRGGSR